MSVVTQAVGWLGSALRVAPLNGGRVYVKAVPATDQTYFYCNDVHVPPALTSSGAGVSQNLILFVTTRPTLLPPGAGPTNRMLPVAQGEYSSG